MKNKILMVRHGESEANINNKILYDKADCNIELTEKGKQQAKKTAEYIKKYIIDKKFSKIYIYGSSFNRAVASKSFILKELENEGLNYENKYSESLVEISFGLYEGLSKEDMLLNYPNEVDYFNRRKNEKDDKGFFYAGKPLGESYWQVCVRIKHDILEIKRLLEKETNAVVIIVAHGGVNRCFAKEYLNMDVNWFKELKNPKNSEVWKIDIENKKLLSLFSPEV